MQETLRQKLRTQIIYASWQLVLSLATIIVWIIGVAIMVNKAQIFNNDDTGLLGIGLGLFILVMLLSMAHLLLWILGIINAAKIQELTGDSIILVVFSIFVFIFAHLIVAIHQKNKFENYKPIVYPINNHGSTNNHPHTPSKEQQLKNAFANGIITAHEYEEKLKKLREKENKQPGN